MSQAAPLDYRPHIESRSPFIRLSLMMFLQYAVWGIWLPILSTYIGAPAAAGGLAFTPAEVGWILGVAASIGAVSSPFIAGQLADRVMNAERALGLLLLLGGLLQIGMTWLTGFFPWLVTLTLYSILYMPTLALTNSVAFANLTDRERQFPPVRTFGTIGWIVASVGFSLAFMQTQVGVISSWPFLGGTPRGDQIPQMKYAMLVAGLISVGYAFFCFFGLPKTPPRREGVQPLAFAAAFRLLTRPNVIALLVAALIVSMIHQVYFIQMGPYITGGIGLPESQVGPIMAIGQVSEIAFLAILGLFLKQIGYKWIIVLGALSYAARYAIFATIPTPGLLKVSMLLHGMNYGFFFAGAYLFVEKIAAADIRHSAQTAFGIVILGLGPILASVYNTLLSNVATREVPRAVDAVATPDAAGAVVAPAVLEPVTVMDFGTLWWIQAALALLAAVVMIVAFPNRWESRERSAAPTPPL